MVILIILCIFEIEFGQTKCSSSIQILLLYLLVFIIQVTRLILNVDFNLINIT